MDDQPPETTAWPQVSSAQVRKAQLWLIALIALVLGLAALRATAAVFIPLVFAVLIALVIAPIDRWVAARLPDRFRWAGYGAALATMLLVVGLFIASLWLAGQQVIAAFPEDSVGVVEMIPGLGDTAAPQPDASAGAGTADPAAAPGDAAAPEPVARLWETFSGASDALIQRVGSFAAGIASSVLGAAGATIGGAVIVIFLTLILLIEAPRWQAKLTTLIGSVHRREVQESAGTIAARLRRYLLVRTVLGLITGLLYAGWLWLFDVDLLLVWGLLAFLLNFIPTFGSLIAGGLAVLYAFMEKDFSTALTVAFGLVVIEQVMGNYVDPRVQGRQIELSALVVLMVVLLWGWIWGAPGAILAVPMTVTTVIVFARIEPLRPIALLLSSARDMDELDESTNGAS